MTLQLFANPEPPSVPGITLRNCGASEMMAGVEVARLVIADPPWDSYRNRPGSAAPDERYPVLSLFEIACHLDMAYDCAAPGARLVMWACWPLLAEWLTDGHRMLFDGRWRWLSGGSWHKEGSQGVGYHWLGRSEPVLLAVKGGATAYTAVNDEGVRVDLGNAHSSQRTDHNEKPVGWYREMLRRWTAPGDLVLSLYSGMYPEGRACAAEGRQCIGAEIDPGRYQMARGRLAQWRTW